MSFCVYYPFNKRQSSCHLAECCRKLLFQVTRSSLAHCLQLKHVWMKWSQTMRSLERQNLTIVLKYWFTKTTGRLFVLNIWNFNKGNAWDCNHEHICVNNFYTGKLFQGSYDYVQVKTYRKQINEYKKWSRSKLLWVYFQSICKACIPTWLIIIVFHQGMLCFTAFITSNTTLTTVLKGGQGTTLHYWPHTLWVHYSLSEKGEHGTATTTASTLDLIL